MKQAMVMAAVVGLMAASGVNAETAAKADPAKAQTDRQYGLRCVPWRGWQ